MAYEASFGQWLISRRRALRMQRTELAAQVGCAVITLRKIESDERRPSLQLAEILAERLGLAPDARATFVRVARGELPADYLPPHQQSDAGARPPQRAPSAFERELAPVPIRTNLPALLTSFIGRSQELEAIHALLDANRLVTLTGVGGVGKTRLAIEVGISLVRGGSPDLIRDGVWVVELASLAQPELVAHAIAQLFRLPKQSGRTSMDQLQEHLAERQMLLLLDNCEHLIETCAAVAEQLLQHCWQLRILATSREPLRVQGERPYPILPLTLPGPSERQPDQVLSTTAAQLLIARMDPGVDRDAAAIAQICRQLDGIPLAIELAAPLSQSMALSEIASQLQNQMAILTNAYRTAIPRHQTMHSALVWSYRLLAPEEQSLLAAAAVFAGGWTAEAAHAVCPDLSAARVVSLLTQMVAKSLVLVEEVGGRRYRMLEPVRQFAQTQLAASGREGAARRRHAEYFLSLAEQMHRARDTSHELEWLDRLELERDNLRAVNVWALAHGEAELAHRFNGWLFAFWIYRSSMGETRGWIDAVLALQAPERTASARTAEALALDTAGYLAIGRRDYRFAEATFARELEIYAEVGDRPGVATAYRGLGFTALHHGDLTQAEVLTVRSLEVSRSVGDHWGAAWSLFDLGYLALVRGDLLSAEGTLLQALAQLLDQDIRFGAYRAEIALGHIWLMQGDLERAYESYTSALRSQQMMGYVQVTSDALSGMAGIAVARGQLRSAMVLFGAEQAFCETYDLQHWPHLDAMYDRDLSLARAGLSVDSADAAWARGHAMPLDEAVAYALGELA